MVQTDFHCKATDKFGLRKRMKWASYVMEEIPGPNDAEPNTCNNLRLLKSCICFFHKIVFREPMILTDS